MARFYEFAALLMAFLSIMGVGVWYIKPRKTLPHYRVRYQRIRLFLRAHPGKGHATLFELTKCWSRFAAWRSSRQTRPDLSRIHKWRNWSAISVYLGSAQWFKRCWVSLQEHVIIFSLPSMGKTAWLADAIIRYPGAVLATSVKDDLYQLTSGIRSLFGPILMFNPEGFGAWPSTFSWNLIRGCEDIRVAVRRAESLINAVSIQDMREGSHWRAKARQMLQAMFHAAALKQGDMRDVAFWTFGDDAEARQILVKHGADQMALTLLELHNSPAEQTAQGYKQILTRALDFMATPVLAQSVLPAEGSGFDIRQFIRDKGTLYLIATGDQDESMLAPLFAAMVSEIKYEAVQMAMGEHVISIPRRIIGKLIPKWACRYVKISSRLTPPLGMFLDECTQICPVPIDKWIPATRSFGIQLFVVVHGIAQLMSRYGKEGAQTVMDTSAVKMALPGLTDDALVGNLSNMCGPVYLAVTGKDAIEQHQMMDSAMIRQLPQGRALVIRSRFSPCIVKTPVVWKNPVYRAAKARRKLQAPLQPAKEMALDYDSAKRIAQLAQESGSKGQRQPEPALDGATNGNGHADSHSSGDGQKPFVNRWADASPWPAEDTSPSGGQSDG